MIENTILCVKWGDKYDDEYVHNLKKQCMENCSVPFNFYCLTDKKTKPYDITLPTKWDPYYDENRGFFWAYRKCYMFKLNESIDGDFIDNVKHLRSSCNRVGSRNCWLPWFKVLGEVFCIWKAQGRSINSYQIETLPG